MPRVDFNCQPSRVYAGLVIALAGVSGVSVCLLPWLMVFKLLIILFIIAYARRLMRREVQGEHPLAVLSLKHHQGLSWEVRTAVGVFQATLMPSAVITRWMSILPFSVPELSQPITCVVFPDTFEADAYRQFLTIF